MANITTIADVFLANSAKLINLDPKINTNLSFLSLSMDFFLTTVCSLTLENFQILFKLLCSPITTMVHLFLIQVLVDGLITPSMTKVPCFIQMLSSG